uniref:MARVEL domain-containing protein n=1 Tax=Panagrellus redivivus TaxID=6233 RepID=A0A7E4V2Q5_PANRE
MANRVAERILFPSIDDTTVKQGVYGIATVYFCVSFMCLIPPACLWCGVPFAWMSMIAYTTWSQGCKLRDLKFLFINQLVLFMFVLICGSMFLIGQGGIIRDALAFFLYPDVGDDLDIHLAGFVVAVTFVYATVATAATYRAYAFAKEEAEKDPENTTDEGNRSQ